MDKSQWQFDAPQFFDFTQPQLYEHQYDDTWFDRHTEADDFVELGKEAGGGTGSAEKAPMKKPQRVLKGGTAAADETRKDKVEHMDIDEKSHSDMGPSPRKRQKLSTESQHVVDSSPPAANTRLQTNSPAVKASSNQQCMSASTELHSSCNEKPASSPNTRSQAKAPNKKLHAIKSFVNKLQGKPQTAGSSSAKKASAAGSASKPGRCPSPADSTVAKNKLLPKAVSTGSLVSKQGEGSSEKLSDPGSKGTGSAKKVKSTEELELEKISSMKKELARTRKLAQDSYKKAVTAQGYVPVRSAQPATLPLGFHFKTDERLKPADGKVQQPQRVKDFAKSLREALPQSTLPTKPQVHGLPRPQPFKLTSAKSTSSVPQAGKYESVAERVAAFHKKTPDRFRSHPHNKERSRSATKDTSGNEKRLRSQSPKLTIAKTPNLTTRGRSRPVNTLTREEIEQMEFEEHQKQQFKAHPVNRKVFEAPSLPKAPVKPLTVAEEFNLYHKKSVSVGDLRGAGTEEEKAYQFHAKPVNHKIFEGPVGVKHVEPQPVTIPESPAFALKNRVRLVVDLPKQDETKAQVKKNPVPYTGVPFRPRLAHHCTVPEPFSVEERSKEMLTRREQKIQQILEEEKRAREFHAQGLPSDSPDALPPKQIRPLTQPEPFHLEVDERGKKYQEEFKSKQIEEEERAAMEAAEFRAGPNDVIHKEPFHVQKSNRPLTEISDIALNTDIRAAKREAYDQHLKAREAELEALKRQREERKEQEELAAVAKMRREAVHRATSIKKYKSVVVMPSEKPLTEPQSPRFSQRIRAKHNNSDV